MANCVSFNGETSRYAAEARKAAKALHAGIRLVTDQNVVEYDLPAYIAMENDTVARLSVRVVLVLVGGWVAGGGGSGCLPLP